MANVFNSECDVHDINLVGWIWCEPDGTIVGIASDGVIVQLGMCLIRKPSKKGGYPIIPMDASTQSYLATHPTPETW